MLTGPAIETLALTITPALGEAFFLISVWKPIVLLVPFVLWARIVSGVLDKHAARWYMPRQMWNIVHLTCGLAAIGAAVVLGTVVGGEGGFFAGFGIAIVILAADVGAYVMKANGDEKVEDKGRLTIGKLFGSEEDPAAAAKKKSKKAGKPVAGIVYSIKQPDAKGKLSETLAPPAPDTPEMEVRVDGEALVTKALAARASQFEIGPAKEPQQYAARWLIDGVYVPGDTMPAQRAIRLMDFWKGAAKQDVADRRRKQVGDISLEDGAGKRIVRVTSLGAQGGMRLTLLFDPEKAVTRKPPELGLLEPQMAELSAITSEKKGVVLVCTPPDGGRTTLLYSILRLHDAYISNVQTVEVEPQAAVEGVRMNRWDPTGTGPDGTVGPEFATLVRSILRRDPDVVAVAELPDQATAKEIAKGDLERSRVYVSFKAGDPFNAVQTWVKAVGETRLAADALRGVVIGRLFRKLCANCRVEYPPSPDMLRKLGIGEGKVQRLFKKGGQVLIKNKPEICPVCAGIGFVGQEGVFEVCSINKDERDLIAAGDLQGLKASFRKRGLPTLQQVAIRKAVDGTTSVEEITRITTSEGSSAEGSGSASRSVNPPSGAGPSATPPSGGPKPDKKG